MGVVLLELVTGSTVDDADSGFIESLKKTLTSDHPLSMSMVDSKLEGKFDEAQVELVITVAKACLNYTRKARPKMNEVKESFYASIGSQFS